MSGSFKQGASSVNNMVVETGKSGATRLRSAGTVIQSRANMVKNKLAKDTIEMGELADTAITAVKNLDPRRIKVMETTMENKVIVHDPAENTHTFANTVRDVLSRVDGVNIKNNRNTQMLERDLKVNTIEDVGKVRGVADNVIDASDTVNDVIKGTGNREAEVPPAFRQTDFASSYEARYNQTPSPINSKVEFEGIRGESLSTFKPPPDPKLKRILDEAGIKGIQYKNGVPDFSPLSKAQLEIDYMLGGNGKRGTDARRANFAQADRKLADKLNNSPEMAHEFGMEPGEIKARDIERYREKYKLTWHELNDVKTMQLVPSEINRKFGHLGGVGEINAGAFGPEGFADK